MLDNPQTPEQLKLLSAVGGLEAQVQTQLDQQYQQIEIVLKSGKPEALTATQNNEQLPPALKDRLNQLSPAALNNLQTVETTLQQIKASLDQQKPTIVAQAREQALPGALQGLNAAQVEALTRGQALGSEINGAIKQSFAPSITQIYHYVIWLVVAALVLIAVLLPELPLRTTNYTKVVQSFE